MSVCKSPVAPSSIPLQGGVGRFFNPPRELTSEEIKDIIKRFGTSAKVAKKAGFTGVQIHAAHGYLINQFLSPHHNERTDEWGGNLNSRMKFLSEVYNEIRSQVGEGYPVSIKLNSADFQRGSFTEEESMEVLKIMAKAGIDLIEISGGNYENPKMLGKDVRTSTKEREAYFLDYAKKARKLVNTPLVVTGGFRSEVGMATAIQSGAIDMVGIGKPFALNPKIPNEILQGTYETVLIKEIKTGFNFIDKKMSSMLDLAWYERQFARLAKGLAPDPALSAWTTILHSLILHGSAAFQRRRI